MGVLIYNVFYILIFANEPPTAEGVSNIIAKLLSYTREFGEHMIVDVDRFWTNREHTILEAEKVDGKALSSVLYTLPARRFSVINMIHSLPQLPPTTATRIVLRWIALDLGNCDYHQDIFNVNGPRPVNPKVLARINQQLTDKFKDIMLAAVPQNTTGDIMSSSDSRRIASILSLLYEMRKWADMGFRARLLKLLVTIRDQQSIDYAIPIPDPVRMTPTILIYECCMDDISFSDIQVSFEAFILLLCSIICIYSQIQAVHYDGRPTSSTVLCQRATPKILLTTLLSLLPLAPPHF